MERTLIILKPDAVTRWVTGSIMARLEKRGLKLVGNKMTMLSRAILEEHYAHLTDKPFFPGIVLFMTSAPVLLQVWEGKEVTDVVRLMAGTTNARSAQPGTIRGDFAMSGWNNVIHASENTEIAKEEIVRFFNEDELFNYNRIDFDIVYADDEK